MSSLPQGWEEKELSSLIEIIGGGTPKTSIEEYWNGNIPWLSVKDFNNDNRKVNKTEKTITDLGLNKSSTKLLQKDELIISARGTVGELAQIPFPMAFNQSCYGLRSKKDKIDNTFLYYGLKNILDDIRNNTHGSVFSTITKQTFGTLQFKYPKDINEQKRIAEILSAFDDKIELNNQMNKTLEDMATALFKEWFENFNFPNDEGKAYKENGGEFKSSELGEIPIDWDLDEIKKYIDVRDGTHDSPKPQKEGYPLVTSKHIKNNILDLDSPNLISEEDYVKVNKRSKVNTNDILLGMIGTVGDIYLVYDKEINFAIKNVGLFKTSEKNELYEYIYFWLKTPFIKEHIVSRLAGTTQKYISLTELRKLPLLLPSKTVINKFKNIISPVINQTQQNQQQNQTLKKQRDTLIPKLMSGEIRV